VVLRLQVIDRDGANGTAGSVIGTGTASDSGGAAAVQTKRTARIRSRSAGLADGAPPESNAVPVPMTEPAVPFAPSRSMTWSLSTTERSRSRWLLIDVLT